MTQPRDTTRLLMKERDRLAARVTELEAALQEIRKCVWLDEVRRIARAALAGEGQAIVKGTPNEPWEQPE